MKAKATSGVKQIFFLKVINIIDYSSVGSAKKISYQIQDLGFLIKGKYEQVHARSRRTIVTKTTLKKQHC